MKRKLEKIVKKVFDSSTRARRVPIDSMKSVDDCTNLGHSSGDGGYIESEKTNPTYLIGSYCSKSGWRYSSQKRSG